MRQPYPFLPALLSFALAVVAHEARAQQVITSQTNPAGQAVYDKACATCHAMPEATKSPPLDTLRRMGPRSVSHALTNGKMKAQAASLSAKEIDDVVNYLAATADIDNSWIAAHTCSADRRAV
ncbi:MAG: cytochrome c, partial [Nevskiaceae bacterium]|nr:cytochrome c [Nevskiaceae bacterium]